MLLTSNSSPTTWHTLQQGLPPRLRDADANGLVLLELQHGWTVARWNSPESRTALRWCRLPSWFPRPQLPPLLEFLKQSGLDRNPDEVPERLAATAIEAIFAWLDEEGLIPDHVAEARSIWAELMRPALNPEPESPATNGNGSSPHQQGGEGEPQSQPEGEGEPEPEPEPEPAPEPAPLRTERLHHTLVHTTNGKKAHFASKLSEYHVKAIKVGIDLGVTQRVLAGIFRISNSAIAQISAGYTWNHIKVTDEEFQQLATEFFPDLIDDPKDDSTPQRPRGTLKQAREIRALVTKHASWDYTKLANKTGATVEFVEAVIKRQVFRHIRFS